MADIFLSYAKEDRKRAQKLVRALEHLRWDVFWDNEIQGGERWKARIFGELKKARCVLVAWTSHSSIEKLAPFVYREARLATKRGVHLPVLFDGLDRPPGEFEALQGEDLSAWRGGTWSLSFQRLTVAVDNLVKGKAVLERPRTRPVPGPRREIEVAGPSTETGGRARAHSVAVVGMGYVGSALAGLLANAGHKVLAVETNRDKAARLGKGRSHLLEASVDDLLRLARRDGRLRVTQAFDGEAALVDLAIVCVGPIAQTGLTARWETKHFTSVLAEIGQALVHRKADAPPLGVVIVATLRPGDCAAALRALEDSSGTREGDRFVMATSPIFAREGTMVADLRAPPLKIVGTRNGSKNRASSAWTDLLGQLSGARGAKSVLLMKSEEAAAVKLASNAFHALKVTFANEIGRFCKAAGIDGRLVMDTFAQETVLNVSSLYLKPGFAFGGWCLDKDLDGLLSDYYARPNMDPRPAPAEARRLALVEAVGAANRAHIELAYHKIMAVADHYGATSLGWFGLTFKAGSDDLRGSPSMEVIRRIGRSYDVHAFDRDLWTNDLTGRNDRYWQTTVRNYGIRIKRSPAAVATQCRVLVLGKVGEISAAELRPLLKKKPRKGYSVVVDLTGELAGQAHLRREVDVETLV